MRNFQIILLLVSIATSQQKFHSRIVGGSVAPAGNFLWAAALNVTSYNFKHFCGGAVINTQWVLTAAQCVHYASNIIITLGSHQLETDNPNRLILSSSFYITHPQYNPDTLENDIAVVKLHMKIQYTDYIKPIYLPSKELQDFSAVTVVGWGQINDEHPGYSQDLRFVKITTLPNEECKKVFGNQIKDEMVCAAGNQNEGICKGDTGSALTEVFELTQTQFHVGIASFMSGLGCETTHPSGFTRTFKYVDWIKNVTRD